MLRYLTGLTIYHREPVYNLNWWLPSSFYQKVLQSLTISVVDVGARKSSLGEIEPLKKMIDYVGFDADEDEVRRLNQKTHSFHTCRFIAKYVAGHTGTVDFILNKDGGNSSVYPFDPKFSSYFMDTTVDPVDRVVTLPCDSLDNLINDDVDVLGPVQGRV